MKKIVVDTEKLNSAISYLNLAVKEIDELNYRIKLIGNEMIDDIDLQSSSEYESIIDNYNNILKNIFSIVNSLDLIVHAVSKVPELYEETERKNIDRINSLVSKIKKSSFTSNDKTTYESLLKTLDSDDISNSQIIDLINKDCDNMILSTQAELQNDLDLDNIAEGES
jgi:uncharacterized protein YnzC (UPF0291/DUF896 family)